jgi:hypothetical protein
MLLSASVISLANSISVSQEPGVECQSLGASASSPAASNRFLFQCMMGAPIVTGTP